MNESQRLGEQAMSGIFYDPASNRLRVVARGAAHPLWTLVTHNMAANDHHCRRILGELMPAEAVRTVDLAHNERNAAG